VRLWPAAPLPRQRTGRSLSTAGVSPPDLSVVPAEPPAGGRREAGFWFDDLCAAWTEGFQVQFVLGFRDGYTAVDRRPAPGDCSLPGRGVVAAMVCHVLGLPLAVAREGRYPRGALSRTYRAGERAGRHTGYALGWHGWQRELAAMRRIDELLRQGREPAAEDWAELGDGTAEGAARRMMLPARLAKGLGVTLRLPAGGDTG